MGPRHRKNEKPKDFKKSVKKLFIYLKPYYIYIIVATILALIGSIFSIIGPDKIKDITNLIVVGLRGKIDLSKIKNIALFLIIIYFISGITTYIEHFIISDWSNNNISIFNFFEQLNDNCIIIIFSYHFSKMTYQKHPINISFKFNHLKIS